ncbi:MAG: lysostaphin resistance A-like protein [Promethearchaeota archaeon]
MKEKSMHTKIGYYLILLAGVTEFIIGLRYIFSSDPSDQLFGQLSLLEGFFALIGLVSIDFFFYGRFKLKPEFRKRPKGFLTHFTIILLSLFLIQLLMGFIPATVREYDKALAIAFAGPSEESFFRGVLMGIFIALGKNIPGEYELTIPGKEPKKLSMFEIIGFGLSSLFFMLLHVNYYNYLNLMLSVFFSGMLLAFAFWYWEDLTACILAHFTLNIGVVIQSFFMVSF